MLPFELIVITDKVDGGDGSLSDKVIVLHWRGTSKAETGLI